MRAVGQVQARSTGEVRSWPWGMSCRRRGSGGARAGRLDGCLADGCMCVGSWVDEARRAGCRLRMTNTTDDEHNGWTDIHKQTDG